jgi:hypothetical protein
LAQVPQGSQVLPVPAAPAVRAPAALPQS